MAAPRARSAGSSPVRLPPRPAGTGRRCRLRLRLTHRTPRYGSTRWPFGGPGRRVGPGDGELESVYVPEVCRFVQEQLGADQVLSRGWELRRSVAPAEHGAQPPASGVHVDYAPDHVPGMVTRAHARHFPDGPGFRRAVVTSTWRVFSPPPQDWPLALCDVRSVSADDGAPVSTYFVDELPDDPFGRVDHLKPVGSSWKTRQDPAQAWWYFPGMTRDEVLLIKLGDTDHGVAWAAPHSAFADPTVQGAAPRHSIELRTFAYFR
ncbi:CmcJ/NvfI family oxidoreductase [Modestobacter sp. SYSU DS0511]